MSSITQEQVLKSLKEIIHPGRGKDIVALGMVTGISIMADQVTFALEVDPVDSTLRPGPNDYRNPVLRGFYPDPSVTRAGSDYYLVNSTFAYFPGLPIFRSRDLVTWTQIGNAIDRPDMLDSGRLGGSRGVFAPSITYRKR